MLKQRLGQLFILGFSGQSVPKWLYAFAAEHGLGGVVLFDYDCNTSTYGRNISDPQQLQALCRELSFMPSQPLICVDQEGGKVRRLREECGFYPYPSALAFNSLPDAEKIICTRRSFGEMRKLGIHYNLAPVIDINSNPNNPDIGRHHRSWSAAASEIVHNAELIGNIARSLNLGLCVKHFPGIGGSDVNSHDELMNLSATMSSEQLELFYRFGAELPGTAIMLSHGYVDQWDTTYPVSISPAAVAQIRARCPLSLLITDDLQMQGLQQCFGAEAAVVAAVRAGVDLLLIGNNLIADEEELVFAWVQRVRTLFETEPLVREVVTASLKRIALSKSRFYSL